MKIILQKCLNKINNKFELVLSVAKRAQDINNGKIKINEVELKYKPTYLALKELEIDQSDK